MDWRALMDACGPRRRFWRRRRRRAAVGSTVALRALEATAAAEKPPPPGAPRESTTAWSSTRTTKPSTATSSGGGVARAASPRVCELRRELERADPDDRGYLSTSAFGAAVAAAGYGPRTFGPAELRWAASACHHPFAEDAVLYPKYVAMVLVGIERGVSPVGRRGRTREAAAALAAEDAERSAWARETVRAAADAVEAVEREVAARLSTR